MKDAPSFEVECKPAFSEPLNRLMTSPMLWPRPIDEVARLTALPARAATNVRRLTQSLRRGIQKIHASL